jgi:hypothetical protein
VFEKNKKEEEEEHEKFSPSEKIMHTEHETN